MTAPDVGWIVPGALAEYAPIGPEDPWYPCTIASEPWPLGHGQLVAKIRDLGDAYKIATGRDRGPAGGVCVQFLRPRKEG
jgi:hypothetical protein